MCIEVFWDVKNLTGGFIFFQSSKTLSLDLTSANNYYGMLCFLENGIHL